MVNLDKVNKYIDTHLNEHTNKMQEFLRQPSVSAENYGVRECAELLKGYLAELGCKDTRLVETGSSRWFTANTMLMLRRHFSCT